MSGRASLQRRLLTAITAIPLLAPAMATAMIAQMQQVNDTYEDLLGQQSPGA